MAKKRAAEIKRLAETLGKQETEGTKETPPPPEGTKEMPPPPVPKKKAKAAKPPVPAEASEEAEKPQKKRKTPPKGTGGEKPKDGDVVKTDPPKDAEPKKYETVDSKGKKTLRAPDFPISWDNHHRLMDFYNISEEEATTILLQVVGPHPNGQAFWDRFRAKPNSASDEDLGKPQHFTRAEEELLNDSQLPPVPSPESVATTSVESGGSGSALDQLETQIMEAPPQPEVPAPADPPQPSKVWVWKLV